MARKAAPPSLEQQGEKPRKPTLRDTAGPARRGKPASIEAQGREPVRPTDVDGDDELEQQDEGIDIDRLAALAGVITTKRRAAIDHRANSGIEDVWEEDEEAYDGVDNANRHEEHIARAYRTRKPIAGASIAIEPEKKSAISSRSSAYLCITASYVDGAAARTADMLLPSDDRPWGITPTPIPELIEAMKAQGPVRRTTPDGQEVDLKKIAAEVMKIGKETAEKAQQRIEDWLTECQWHREVRKVINDCARLGTGVLKGPYPRKKKQVTWQRDKQTGRVTMKMNQETKPNSNAVSPWNMYPDPACGEDPHRGGHIFERDEITKKILTDLRDQPGYIKSQIEACLDEGPAAAEAGTPMRQENFSDDTTFEIWYMHGFLSYDDMVAAGCEDCEAFAEDKYAMIPAIVTMVNNRVIKVAMNPLDSGEFPYDFMVWKRRRDMPWGMGVSRQVRTPQRIVNAATRNLLDNAGLTAGPQIVLMRGVVHPADGIEELSPLKFWYAEPDANIEEVKNAFMAIEIKCNQADLMAIVEFALRMAEDVTGMPMLMQGQQGDAPELVGVVTILNNNANSVLRRIARQFDDSIIEPHIGRYYTYLMQYGEDEAEKGLYIVDARGSSVLVERDIQNQAILGMAQMALNPVFRIDPHKYATEALKAQRLDPERFMYDDAEWEEIQRAAAEGPQDPRLVVAQMKTQIDKERLQLDERLAKMQAVITTGENEKQRRHEILIEGMQHEINAADLEGRQQIGVGNIKAMLAKAVIAERSKAIMQGRELRHARSSAGKGRGI